MKILAYSILFSLFLHSLHGQERTVGLQKKTDDAFYPGYTLFSPAGNTTTYLINECGQMVHSWESQHPPGNAVYLQPDGSIYRASRVEGAILGEPGVGGRIERISWDGTVIWFWEYSSDTVNHHHDFHVLPDGNLLLIAWRLRSAQEAIDAGRDPLTLSENALWPDHVIEVEPMPNNQGNIVWMWDSWDHMIQDFDPTKDNYGSVSANPGKIDINFRYTDGADWHHVNSINYIPDLDHIILSVPFFDELWIIDHGITTAEAKGPLGDLLYRWGNPQTYKMGTDNDKKLFFQHTVEWLGPGLPDEGKLIIFNNGRGRMPEQYSSINILNPFNMNGDYEMMSGVFLPETFDWEYTAANPTDFYASFISGAQQLPNGNVLIDDGPKGTFFEVDAQSETVWEYINPVTTTSGIVSQGDPVQGNLAFRATRYATDHPAFEGRDMSPKDYIEGEGVDFEGCPLVLAVKDTYSITLYPNPTRGLVNLGDLREFEVVNSSGQMVLKMDHLHNGSMDLSSFPDGLYLLRTSDKVYKIVKSGY